MGSRKWFVAGMIAVALAMVLGLPAAASAAYTNPDCVGCHSSSIGAVAAQDFGVGAVDFTRACKKCHDDSLVGTHPYHNPTANCGSSCHPGWGASLVSAVPNYVDSRGYGAFAAANSADTDPALLHLIHSKPRWMESKEFSFSKCGSCHAVATCDSCHDNPPAPDDTTHANHATSLSLSPWMGNTSSGVTNGDQLENTYVLNNAIRCGAVGCHDTAGVADSSPRFLDDKSHTANAASGYLANTVTKTPASSWRVMFSNVYTLGQISQSNTTNSTLSVPFTGEQFILVADKDPYRGIAEVLVDGVSQGTVDLYQDTTVNQVEVFKSAVLSSGPHTIAVRVTGTKNPAARAAYVRVDQFKVFSNAPGDVAPACTSCHPSNADAHGTGNFSHEATGSAAATFSGKRCDSCHAMPMTTEHARVSSSSAADSCNACHTTYAPKAMTAAWNTTCAYGTCHVAARTPHTAMAAGHTPTSDPAEAACRGCHAGDLAAIHNDSITTNTAVSSCNSCHTPTTFPSTKSCVDSSCHGATVNGTISVDGHNFNTAKHTATPWTSVYQGVSPTVSTGGKECSSCHSARVDTAHTGVTGGTVSCTSGGAGDTGCHNNTTLNGRAVASAAWPTNKCSDCHNYAANSSHDATVAPHAVASGSCAGTINGCHTDTDLWVLHSKNQGGGAPAGASCSNTGCHDAGNVDKRPTLKTCGTGNDCHADKDLGTHPGAKDHSFTATSDYAAATETGCTNSGAGCHGADATRADMAVPYHPATGCISGVCHQSADKAAYGGSNECVSCHDGNYQNAPDRVALTTAHYNETTHTAGGSSTTVAAGGTASATCANCHNSVSAGIDGLYAQHQGLAAGQVSSATYANVACGECHSYSTQMSAVVNTAWDNTCAACHTGTLGLAQAQHGTTAPVVNTTSSKSCGATGTNCHTTYDVHALHKDAAGGCALTGCHDYTKQGLNPTIQTCGQSGGCHATYTADTHAHAADAAKHQPTNTTQASATTFASTACGSCHDIRNSNSSLTLEHSLSTSAKTGNANVCLNCHNNAASTTAITGNWATKDTTTACSTCHTGTLAIHADANSTAHGDVTSAGCSSSGIGCHNTSDLSQVGVTTAVNTNIHANCLRCHDRTATAPNLAFNPANDTCGSGRECHGTAGLYNTTTFVHNGSTGAGLANGNDTDHHTDSVMTGTMTQGVATATCATCHSGTLATAHATSLTTWTNTCTSCHNSTLAGNVSANQVKAGWTNNDCGDCHVAGASAVKIPNMHSNYGAAAHNGTSTQSCGASGAGCHTTYDLAVLHGATKTNGCALAGCHDSVDKAMGSSAKSCGSGGTCHSTYTATAGHRANTITGDDTTHTATAMTTKIDGTTYDIGGGNTCSSCHSSGLKSAHTGVTAVLDSARAAWTTPYCANCHNSASAEANSVTTIKTNSWSAQTCDQCHVTNGNGKHTTYTLAKHTATLNAGCTASGVGCHNTADVRTIHNKATVGCTASGTDGKGWTGACHALNTDMPTAQMSCGSGGCHTNHTNSNHGAAHTLDEATSAYNNTTVTGCTGAGAGCHGATNASYAVTQFHPVAGVSCTSSKCHDASATNHNNAAFDDPNSCQDCHGGGTVDYVNAPWVSVLTATTGAAQGHYNETTHTATGGTTAINSGGSASATCNNCHNPVSATLVDQLYTQHQGVSTGSTTCSDCHNYNAAVTAEITNSWTTNNCTDCHKAGVLDTYIKHSNTPPAVTATQQFSCVGADCHAASGALDLHALHKDAAGCNITGCHDYTKQGIKPTSKSCGSGGTCHTGLTSTNHSPDHNANQANGTVLNGITYTYGENAGCFMAGANTGCHFQDLRREHGTTAYLSAQGVAGTQRTMNGNRGTNANGCATCHSKVVGTAAGLTGGTYSGRTAVAGAIAANDYRCVTCHFESTDAAGSTGVQTPHKTTEKLADAPLGTTQEWAIAAAQGGGHNSFGNWFPRTSGFGTVNGVNVTTTNMAIGGTYQSGWSNSSIVTCTSTGCHNRTSTPNGPQGATVPWYWNNGTAVTGTIGTHWYTASTGSTAIPASTGCNNCHATLHNVHRSDHNVQCQNCHIRIPHAWKRPRLLRRIIDDGGPSTEPIDGLPYTDPNIKTNSLDAYRVTTTQTNFTSGSSCNDNCGKHNAGTPYWP